MNSNRLQNFSMVCMHGELWKLLLCQAANSMTADHKKRASDHQEGDIKGREQWAWIELHWIEGSVWTLALKQLGPSCGYLN